MRFLLICLLVAAPGFAMAERVALVIGNAAYRGTGMGLANPANDARAVSAALREQDFVVTQVIDATREQFIAALSEFRPIADKADIALVYYAGHGLEVGGRNFLVPVDATLADERDVETQAISMRVVLSQISGASKLKMLVLDACRDNPFIGRMEQSGTTRSLGRGLALVDNARPGTLIAYAAAPGEVTPDGVDGADNSPFTIAFLRALRRPPADVGKIMRAARDEMSKLVEGARPFVSASRGAEDVIINPNSPDPNPRRPSPMEPTETFSRPDAGAIYQDYAAAVLAETPEALDAFLQKYKAFPKELPYVLALRERAKFSDPSQEDLGPTEPKPDEPGEPETPIESNDAPLEPSDPITRQNDEASPPDKDRKIAPSVDDLKKQLQTVLKERNCYTSSIDGIWGRGSRAAMDRFSRVSGGLSLSVTRRTTAEDMLAFLTRMEAVPNAICVRDARRPSTPASVGGGAVANAPPPPTTPPVSEAPVARDNLTAWERSFWNKNCAGGKRTSGMEDEFIGDQCRRIGKKLR